MPGSFFYNPAVRGSGSTGVGGKNKISSIGLVSSCKLRIFMIYFFYVMSRQRISWIMIAGVTLLLTFTVTCRVFDSRFAEITVDYFAFFAGIFLISEGIYRIVSSGSSSVLSQLSRIFRVLVGTCVFTIHVLQFMKY